MTDPTLRALYAAIVANPGEDTPRLAFADAAEELGLEADRVALIKAQYLLREIGPEPKVFHARLTPLPGGGFGFHAAPENELKVGEVVTVGVGELFHTRRISKVRGGDVVSVFLGPGELPPWPRDEVIRLEGQVRAILEIHADWQPPNTRVELGFASVVDGYPGPPLEFGERLPRLEVLCDAHPIHTVRFQSSSGTESDDHRLALCRATFPRVRHWRWPGFARSV